MTCCCGAQAASRRASSHDVPGQARVLETLDGVKRVLDDQTVLVCDSEGPPGFGQDHAVALRAKIQPTTRNVLLEVASWNYINIRRTMSVQKMSSEAGVRFSRGVHPERKHGALLGVAPSCCVPARRRASYAHHRGT